MYSLNEVRYEHIKNNFWYGIFGDFKIIIDNETGFFNATKLCQSGGKILKTWKKSKTAKDSIKYYTDLNCKVFYVKESVGITKADFIISGTYMRKELFLALAIWISHEIYGQCYTIIEQIGMPTDHPCLGNGDEIRSNASRTQKRKFNQLV